MISVFGINFIPLELLLDRGFSVRWAMLLYLCENLFAIVISAMVVYFLAPAAESGEGPRTRSDTIVNFVVAGGFTTVVTGILLTAFIFLVLKASFSVEVFVTSLIWMVGFQIFEFAGAAVMISPLSLKRAETFLNRTLLRVILLMLCVLFGVFCAAWIDAWFVIPFIVLKTLVDLGGQCQVFREMRALAVALAS